MSDNEVIIESGAETIEKLLTTGRQLAGVEIKAVSHSVNTPLAIVPPGMEIKDLSEYIPKRPDRKRIAINLNNIESFIAYVNENKDENSRIFASITEDPYEFVCAIDFHRAGPEGNPEWITHIVTLKLTITNEWCTWVNSNGKSFTQEEFIEFLKDNRLDIIDPCGAKVIEIAETLEMTLGGRCRSSLDLKNGSRLLEFQENIEAKAGKDGKIEIPNELTLMISPFIGIKPFETKADFRFRQNSGNVRFGYRLLAPQKIILDTVNEALKEISKQTKLTVFQGSFTKS